MTTITIKLPADAQQTYNLGSRQMNTVSIDVPAYTRSGILSIWEDDYKLPVDVDETTTIVIRVLYDTNL